jgi:hypothetical protein
MNKLKWILLLLVTAFLFYSHIHVNVVSHDENSAAQAAKKFAEVIFVKQDFKMGYSLLSDQAKSEISPEKFKQIFISMHPTGYPLTVFAVAFEPIPGANAINIYLRGENGKEEFYYRFYMQGTKKESYKTAGFFRIGKKGAASKLFKWFGSPI